MPVKAWKVEETNLANKDIRIGRKMHLGHVAFASKGIKTGKLEETSPANKDIMTGW